MENKYLEKLSGLADSAGKFFAKPGRKAAAVTGAVIGGLIAPGAYRAAKAKEMNKTAQILARIRGKTYGS